MVNVEGEEHGWRSGLGWERGLQRQICVLRLEFCVLSARDARPISRSKPKTQNANLHSIELRTWSTKFYSYAGDREVRIDHWTGSGRGRWNPLAILRFVRLGWQTPRRYLSPERNLLVLLSSRHLHSDQCRSHAVKLVVQALICIDRKSSEICDRCRLCERIPRLRRKIPLLFALLLSNSFRRNFNVWY